MDCIPEGSRRPPSRVSTATSTIFAFDTPPSSETDSTSTDHAHLPAHPAVLSGPPWVTSLSVTDWRPQYPRIGQFAMTPSEEVVAATPDGLVYFRRVQDHPSMPWSEPRPFPPTSARLNSSTVTGLAVYQTANGVFNVYCVAAGQLHAFSRSEHSSSPFAVDPCPPFAGLTLSGTPAVARTRHGCHDDGRSWCIVVPCPSGGLLYTSTDSPSGFYGIPKASWEPPSKLAAHLGIISAVSIAYENVSKPGGASMYPNITTNLVAVCIASSRLHSIEGPFETPSRQGESTWKAPKSIRIQHPGEVTGNPVLLTEQKSRSYQLDLFVPSAEGGVFHFIRTATTPDEWHMIGRIRFPTGIPMASSLACRRVGGDRPYQSKHRAFVQCGGRLYLIKTSEGAQPWVGSLLYPVNGPGPFLH